MCGIAGYIGFRLAKDVLIDNLKKLEYRGYDSTGIATLKQGKFSVLRSQGKLKNLEKKVNDKHGAGHIGIGHTRWATHGVPSDENAHPHRSPHLVVVHNGIIENHLELKKQLEGQNFTFSSQTDTEIIPILIESHLQKDHVSFEEAVKLAIAELKGSFAFAVMCKSDPEHIIVAKNASPLIIGVGENEMFLASDIPALLDYTKNIIVLEDGQMAKLSKDRVEVQDFFGHKKEPHVKSIAWSRMAAEKEGYKHFMLKEIYEQPRAIADSMRSRLDGQQAKVKLDELNGLDFKRFDRILINACGTSYHSGLIAKHWFERYLKIPTEVSLASEFRYSDPIVGEKCLWLGISQSGETADTLAALLEAKSKGAHIVTICNSMDSSMARASQQVLYTQAGPEISVASTKAFSTQLSVLALLCIQMMQDLNVDVASDELLEALLKLPEHIQACLDMNQDLEQLAMNYTQCKSFLFLGRGTAKAIAMEGALKLKEISYIHAEAYAAGEMKHGPIALIDQNMPVLAITGQDILFEKTISNVEEVAARGAKLLLLCDETQNVSSFGSKADIIRIPKSHVFTRPIIENIPLQLFAYHVADKKGLDVDQPRNLAKSVTVE